MITLSISGLIIAFILIALLLLSLNLYSSWSWPVKAGCIVLVSLFYLVCYFSFPPLLGWPTAAAMPEKFRLLGVHIQEPDKISGTDGEIYLWVADMTSGRKSKEPRAYRLPFDSELHSKVVAANAKLQKKLPQLGEISENDETAIRPTDETRGGQVSVKLEFFDLPDPLFPEK